jgi:hypothetical protein
MYTGKNSVLSLYTGWRKLVTFFREFGNSDCRASNCSGYGWKRSWPDFIYYLGICLERLNKITNLSQCNLFPGRGLNLGPPEYEARGKHSAVKFSLLLLLLFIPQTSDSAGILWLMPCSKPSAVWVRSHIQGLPGGKGRHSCTLATCPYLQGDFKVNT